MSIEQPVDPQLIEQTKQQIRSLVAEIAQLSKTDVAPEEFYGQFLPRVVSALAAVGGAVWTLNPEGRLALQYQINIQETQLRESEERTGPAQPAAVQNPLRRRGDAGAAALGARAIGSARTARRRRRQSDRVPPGARPVEDRPGDGRPGRDFSALRRRADARRRAICGSSCRCASWPAIS